MLRSVRRTNRPGRANPADPHHRKGSAMHYEVRTYTYAPGDLPKVLDAWGKVIESRERLSPLAACWTSELGGLNKFTHIWPYKDLAERTRVREESRRPGSNWPPQSG